MKLFTVLSLAATGAAIDAVIHTNSQYCEGRWIGCLNLNPNVCCSIGERGYSTRFSALVKEWNLELRSYQRPNCDENSRRTYGWDGRLPNSVCAESGPGREFWSVGYGFRGKKRDATSDAANCEQPNALGLADGTQYNLTAMNDVQVKEIMALTEAKVAADLPGHFGEFTM